MNCLRRLRQWGQVQELTNACAHYIVSGKRLKATGLHRIQRLRHVARPSNCSLTRHEYGRKFTAAEYTGRGTSG